MKAHICNLRECSEKDIEEHISYLDMTPVRQFATYLRQGAHLSKGVICSRDELGGLSTIFGELGGLSSQREYGRERFLVREVLPTLQDFRCKDDDALRSVRYFIDSLRDKPVDMRTTICESQGDWMIIDGNKRASACYEADFMPVPVYLLRCTEAEP